MLDESVTGPQAIVCGPVRAVGRRVSFNFKTGVVTFTGLRLLVYRSGVEWG